MRSNELVPDPGSGFSIRRQVIPSALVMSPLATQPTPGNSSHWQNQTSSGVLLGPNVSEGNRDGSGRGRPDD